MLNFNVILSKDSEQHIKVYKQHILNDYTIQEVKSFHFYELVQAKNTVA